MRYNSVEEEKKAIEEFVSNNPYPSYEEILSLIKPDIEMWAEYGEPNHYFCKEIYENVTNKEIVKKSGERIDKRGGIQAMRQNYYVLKLASPLKKIYHINPARWISVSWNGVGRWLD
jgi:dissimilatory sulfite reductase (desulfoviridin) alpha/beta subunit